MTNTHAGFFPISPRFVAGLQLIQDWISPPLSGSWESRLLLWCNTIACSSALLCSCVRVRVCMRLMVATYSPFDVSPCLQLTKCTQVVVVFLLDKTHRSKHFCCKGWVSTHECTLAYTWTCRGMETEHGWIMQMLYTHFKTPSHVFSDIQKQMKGDCQLVHRGEQIQTAACNCCWQHQRHKGAESCIILSFSWLPATLRQILVFHFSALVLLSGVA